MVTNAYDCNRFAEVVHIYGLEALYLCQDQ